MSISEGREVQKDMGILGILEFNKQLGDVRKNGIINDGTGSRTDKKRYLMKKNRVRLKTIVFLKK